MKTLEDLQRIREQAKEAIKVRDGKHKCKIVIAMGTCGIASGARETMAAVLDEIEKKGLTDIAVTQTGCKGLCDQEPTVDIVKTGQPGVTYGNVTPERAREIVDKHVMNDEIQGEWVISREPR